MPTFALGPNQYGKAEIRLVRVTRHESHDELQDLNVSVALRGDLSGTHIEGDNSSVLPTDTQKNTVYAFAREHGIADVESFAIRLARHFVDSQASIHGARVMIEVYPWQPAGTHTFRRDGAEVRTATVRYDGTRPQVTSGLTGLVLLKTTDSEFHGFVKDRYTTLRETADRILATSVEARWRYLSAEHDAWDTAHEQARAALIEAFADTHSLALQQTLYAMGSRLLLRRPEVAEVRLTLPNKHHFLVDLAPFGLDNPNQVYFAADRPYGQIEGIVRRDGVDLPEESAWSF